VTRVLVTGATGFIGRGTLAPLLETGAEVHAVTSRPTPAGTPADVRWHRCDLLAPGREAALLVEVAPTHLLHLAWYAEPGRFWSSEENLRWVEASLRLLRAFAAGGGRRAVLAGTCAEYAWEHDTHCVEGETRLEPATLYGSAKHALHTVLTTHAGQAGYSLAWGRVFFVYGPHEHEARLAASVSRALVRGEPASTSSGEQVRDFLFAPDLANAFVALLSSEVEGPVNMAAGVPVRLRDLIEALGEAAGRSDLLRLGERPASPGEPARLTADTRRLRDEVGWTPSVSLAEGARRTIEWWREQAP
jgi:nucleoside-diphosphate-sugar epimerase